MCIYTFTNLFFFLIKNFVISVYTLYLHSFCFIFSCLAPSGNTYEQFYLDSQATNQ